MLVVIFRARAQAAAGDSTEARSQAAAGVSTEVNVKQFDEQYAKTAARLRTLALEQFGCIAFHAVSEGQEEIALSYWPDEQHLQAWRAHPEHVEAQKLGQSKWYEFYSVEVARIERSYQSVVS